MKSNRDELKEFFQTNQTHIESHYPGVNFSIFEGFALEAFSAGESDVFVYHQHIFFEKVMEGVPFEYITNSKYLYRSNFYVDARVLIPRSESEILIDDALNFIKNSDGEKLAVAEVGIGSFALGLSILIDSTKPLHFWGGDISSEALEVAEINRHRLRFKINPTSLVELCLSDRLSGSQALFDLIISNPPYIKDSQDTGVHSQVLNYEPRLALFLTDSEHDKWFKDLFESTYDKLNKNGAFFMEGHEDNLSSLNDMAQKIFKRVIIKNDYTGRPRFLHCFKEN